MRHTTSKLKSFPGTQPRPPAPVGHSLAPLAGVSDEGWLRQWRRVVVIAPHCDDLELGCGGLVARLSAASAEIAELVMAAGDVQQSHRAATTCRSLRMDETHRAAQELGIGRLEFAMAEESRLDVVPMVQGIQAIQRIIDETLPDLLLVNLPSSNQDHRWVYDCAIAALRPWRNGHRPRTVLGYEYPLLFWGGYDAVEMPLYVDVTDHMASKLRAVAAHGSQLRPGPLSVEAVELFSRQRGMEAGVAYAERFKLIMARL